MVKRHANQRGSFLNSISLQKIVGTSIIFIWSNEVQPGTDWDGKEWSAAKMIHLEVCILSTHISATY